MSRWTALLFACAAATAAHAQSYPSKPVRVVVAAATGGPDTLARVVGAQLQQQLGQPFVIENQPGANGIVGAQIVSKAPPDGYTLLVYSSGFVINPAMHKSLPYDTEKDLAAVAFINRNPLVLIGRKTLAPTTLAELIAHMKNTSVTMAHPGSGSSGHLATALFAQEAKVKPVQVPYRGGAPMVQDILGNHVDLLFGTPQQLLPLVAGGQVKAYGFTAKETHAQLPGAASLVGELGPKLEIFYWHALFAPAATPKPVIDKLNAVVQTLLDDTTLMKNWADTGVTPYPPNERSPQAAQALMKSEIARWGEVVRENRIQPAD